MAGITLKKFAVTFKISKKGKKTKMHKEKPKVTYSMAMAVYLKILLLSRG